MSRGPGRIERAIESFLDAEPDNAFSTVDLCWRVYRGINRVEKKHRVSVTRAAWKIAQRREGFGCFRSETLGGTSVWFNSTCVTSYAMGRLKSRMCNSYHGNDKRHRGRPETEDDLRALIRPGGRYHKYVIAGGAWWRHAESAKAEIEARRAGDEERLRQVLGDREAQNAAIKRALGFR